MIPPAALSSSCCAAGRCTAWHRPSRNCHNKELRPSRPPFPILSQLLKAETAEREVRPMAYQLKAARFPVYRDLAGFDFASSEVNEALVRQLHRCDFIEPTDNIVLAGGALVPARPTSPPRLAYRPSSTTRSLLASSPPSNWSTPSNRKRLRERPARSPVAL